MNIPAVEFTSFNTADLPGQAQQCITVIKHITYIIKKITSLWCNFYMEGGYKFDKGESEILVSISRHQMFLLTSEQVMVLFGPWGTPSSWVASPVKNVHVVALHAISSVLKSLVSMGVTNNPSRPIHHQGMFIIIILFWHCLLITQHKNLIYWLMTGNGMDRNFMFFHWDCLSTYTCAVLHLSMEWPKWQWD